MLGFPLWFPLLLTVLILGLTVYLVVWTLVLSLGAVVLALGQCAPSLLSRAVLYTAVARARSLLIVVGDEEVFTAMVENNRTQKRYSGLKTRLST